MNTKLPLLTLFLSCPILHGIDLNSNGVDDIYESLYPAALMAGPTADSDGDGSDNFSEALALTDPTDPADYFRCLPILEDADQFSVRWPSKPGLQYRIQHCADMQSWVDVGSVATGTGAMLSQGIMKEDLIETVDHFFRVKVVGEVDTDSDGISDWAEEILGFSPTDANSVRSAANGGDMQQLTNLLTGASPSGGLAGSATPGVPSDEHASRFLAQATFGPRLDDMAALKDLGPNAYEKWIDQQLALPPSYVYPYLEYLAARYPQDRDDFYAGLVTQNDLTYQLTPGNNYPNSSNLYTGWMRNAINGKDQLRQRMAWALSQIFVVSRASSLTQAVYGFFDFQDHLVRHGLGNFQDLLTGVSRHPMMGVYLTSIFNEKPDPANGIFPDENYAREVMQLFSIGLAELNLDGTPVTNPDGTTAETYDNSDILALARIFTGMQIAGKAWGSISRPTEDMTGEMSWDTNRKDADPKVFIRVPGHEVSDASDGYNITWQGLDNMAYMVQYRHPETLDWKDAAIHNSTSAGVQNITVTFADTAVGLGSSDLRVKHYYDSVVTSGPVDLTVSENETQYLLTWETQTYVNYEVFYRPNGTGSFVLAGFLGSAAGGPFTMVLPKSAIGNSLDESDFNVSSLGGSRPPIAELNILMRVLTNHPNTAPFMAKHFIKHFVTSDPSPAYVERVATVFKNNGNGVTGDLAATLKAVLLDPDARGTNFITDPKFGKLKEPMLRLTMLARAFDAGRDDSYEPDPADPEDLFSGLQWWDSQPGDDFLQLPYAAPSVFNFYEPDYSSAGLLRDNNLESPEFQILNPITATTVPNRLLRYTEGGRYHNRITSEELIFDNDYSSLVSITTDSSLLADRVNLLLAHGQITAAERQSIVEGIDYAPTFTEFQREFRRKISAFLTTVAPNGAVIK